MRDGRRTDSILCVCDGFTVFEGLFTGSDCENNEECLLDHPFRRKVLCERLFCLYMYSSI
jgi:hypothetical protein